MRKVSCAGTPYLRHASRYAPMFSICLNGFALSDGAAQTPGQIALARLQSSSASTGRASSSTGVGFVGDVS